MPQVMLSSLRVLLTRPQGEGNDEWATALRATGAEPVLYPTLNVVPPDSWEIVDTAIGRLVDYDFLVFTSQTTVAFFVGRMTGGRLPPGLRAGIAAVGPATARAVERAGGVVTFLPADNRQEGLVEVLRPAAPGRRVLLPIAAGGRALLAETLRSWGCDVDVITVYRMMPREDLDAPPPFDAAIFASPSALRAYLAGPGGASLQGKTVAVIGRTTAATAAANGVHASTAESPDIESLISAIAQGRKHQGEP
jgi:uroporphyrinogen-III synthase